MRIGILATIIGQMGQKGFYQLQEYGLGSELARMGHEVTVYRCVAEDCPQEESRPFERLTLRYIPVPSLGIHGFFPCRHLDKDLDGLLMFSDTQLSVPAVYRFCQKHRIPFVPFVGVVHSHGQRLHAWLMDQLFSLRNLPVYRKVHVLAKTEAVKAELISQGATDCSVHPVGIDLSVMKRDYRSVDRNALRVAFGYAEDDTVICFVGRLEFEKCPLEMISLFDSVRRTKTCSLLLVGDGTLRKALAAEIERRGLSDCVRLEPRVPYQKMWELYYISDFFVNLNPREIFGMAILEAVYYETSVAAISAPGPDLILKGLPGHRLCRNEDEIAEWLLAPPPSPEALRQSAALMIERCSWKSCAEALVRRIEEAQSGGAE